MSYKVKGTITDVFPTEQITDRFSKSAIWLKTDEQYPQQIEIQFVNQNADLVDNVKAGDTVEVQFGIQGKFSEKNGKVYNSLNGYGMTKV